MPRPSGGTRGAVVFLFDLETVHPTVALIVPIRFGGTPICWVRRRVYHLMREGEYAVGFPMTAGGTDNQACVGPGGAWPVENMSVMAACICSIA